MGQDPQQAPQPPETSPPPTKIGLRKLHKSKKSRKKTVGPTAPVPRNAQKIPIVKVTMCAATKKSLMTAKMHLCPRRHRERP